MSKITKTLKIWKINLVFMRHFITSKTLFFITVKIALQKSKLNRLKNSRSSYSSKKQTNSEFPVEILNFHFFSIAVCFFP